MAIHSSSLAWKITSFNKVFSNFVVLDAVSNGSEVKVARSWLTLCDPMDYTVHGILQARILERETFPFSKGSLQPHELCGKARILEWVAFPLSRGSSQPRNQTQVS